MNMLRNIWGFIKIAIIIIVVLVIYGIMGGGDSIFDGLLNQISALFSLALMAGSTVLAIYIYTYDTKK